VNDPTLIDTTIPWLVFVAFIVALMAYTIMGAPNSQRRKRRAARGAQAREDLEKRQARYEKIGIGAMAFAFILFAVLIGVAASWSFDSTVMRIGKYSDLIVPTALVAGFFAVGGIALALGWLVIAPLVRRYRHHKNTSGL
jgi:Na+/H+ antiporter NhaC